MKCHLDLNLENLNYWNSRHDPLPLGLKFHNKTINLFILSVHSISLFKVFNTDLVHTWRPQQDGLVVSLSASHEVGCGFGSRLGSNHRPPKKWYRLPPCLAHRHYGRSLTVQPDCHEGRLVCGIVYGDMHFKDLLGSISRVWYRIPVPDFYLVLHGLQCWKSTVMD